jgi:hypothetical protein
VTDTKKSDFSQTDDALAELNAALMHLSEVAEGKKRELDARLREQQSEAKQKDQKLELLTESCTNIVSNIDGIINRLDKILEDNGTSNNNN